MHGDVAPHRTICIRDPALPAETLRQAPLAAATTKADHLAIVQATAATTARAIAAATTRAEAEAAITAADTVAAPVQAAGAGTAAAMAEEMVVATEAGANADRTSMIPRPSYVPHDATRIIRMGNKTEGANS